MAAALPRLATRPRAIVRAVHVLASIGWFGLVVVMLVLSAAALTTDGGPSPHFPYQLMDQIASPMIPITAVATLVTGVALSVATPWGLLRHWWIVVKLVLTLAVIMTGASLTGSWILQASAGPTTPARWLLVGGAAVHLLMLASAMIISVDKPWGRISRSRKPRGRPLPQYGNISAR
ncbi:MAG TPA: hypothetical protein VFA63_10305 [Pseudonocardiaceae bacterium]|jgi:uncharacterized membrane protein|nr:hypothetical protein [Pseudonocardiaceae bacterium]